MKQNKSTIIAALITLVLIGGLYAVTHQTDNPESSAIPVIVPPPKTYDTRTGHADPGAGFDLTIDDDKLVSGPSTIKVKKGDSVVVRIKAGGSEEIKAYLDGYNIMTESAPEDDEPGGFSFIADTAGSFHFYAVGETDGHKTQLGTIVVAQ